MSEKKSNLGRSSFLRWAGSKRQLIRRLTDYWDPAFQRYVEPFAGSSALFFAIRPARAVLADKNSELIRAYEVVRKHPTKLHNRLLSIPRCKEEYYDLRSQDPTKLSPFQQAVRFLYLNRFCFNGLYRTNSSGQFNVPFSPNKTGGFPSLKQFQSCAKVLENADLHAWDFGTTLRYVQKGDFVYLDPPFAVESRRVFREYGARSFTKRDLVRLADHLQKIDKRKATFVVSYADCTEARQILSGWKRQRVRVRRNIAGFSGARRTAYELIITNASS